MRRRLYLGAALGGALAALGAASHAVRETITVNVGDTLVPRFTVSTDSVLKVSGSSIVARSCGKSMIYLRTWRKSAQVSADTVNVNVVCPGSPPATTASSGACLFPNSDSLAKYQVRGDTSIDPRLVPCDSVSGTLSPGTAGTLMRKAQAGSDAINPAMMRWSTKPPIGQRAL